MSEWISVEDKAPEESENLMGSGFSRPVLVVDSEGDMTVCSYMYPWQNMDMLGFRPAKGTGVIAKEITHWMPLPPPPTERE